MYLLVGWLLLRGGLGGVCSDAEAELLLPALGSPSCKRCGTATLGLANHEGFLQLFGSPVNTCATRFLELNSCDL